MLPASDIRLKNLLDLQFAQALLREDVYAGMHLLGIGVNAATLLAQLTPRQTETLASADFLLFGFRLQEDALVQRLKAFADGNAAYSLTHTIIAGIGRKAMIATPVA